MLGMSASVQTVVPESPESAECASAPKTTTLLATLVLAGVLLAQGVPDVGAVQV
jgi:hypothetical protein